MKKLLLSLSALLLLAALVFYRHLFYPFSKHGRPAKNH